MRSPTRSVTSTTTRRLPRRAQSKARPVMGTASGKEQAVDLLQFRRLRAALSGFRRCCGQRPEVRRKHRNPTGQPRPAQAAAFTAASRSRAAPRGQTVYLRREWGYIGTDQLGTLRLGSTDGPSSLYMTGNFENFNDGGLDGDVNFFLPGNATLVVAVCATSETCIRPTRPIYLVATIVRLRHGRCVSSPRTSNIVHRWKQRCRLRRRAATRALTSSIRRATFTAATGANGNVRCRSRMRSA